MKLWIPLSISFIIFSASIVYLYHQWKKVEEEAVKRNYNYVYLKAKFGRVPILLSPDIGSNFIKNTEDKEKDTYIEEWIDIFDLRVNLQYRLFNESIQDTDYKKQKEELITREDSVVEKYTYNLQKASSKSSQGTSVSSEQKFVAQEPKSSTEKLPNTTSDSPSKIPKVIMSTPTGHSPSATSYASLLVPIGGLIISAFTFASTFFFSWRTDRRNEKESQLKIIQLQQELASRGNLC